MPRIVCMFLNAQKLRSRGRQAGRQTCRVGETVSQRATVEVKGTGIEFSRGLETGLILAQECGVWRR